MKGRWIKVFAGFYRRIGTDGTTVLAEVIRGDEGWDLAVYPHGEEAWASRSYAYPTLAEAKTVAEAKYKDSVRRLNAGANPGAL